MRRATNNRKVMPLAEWPGVDQETWANALAGGVNGEGAAANWSPETVAKTERAWGHLLQWQADTGGLQPGLSPGERLTKATAKAFVAAKTPSMAPQSIGVLLSGLCDAARVMVPGGDWGWVRRLGRAVIRDAGRESDSVKTVVDPALVGHLGIVTMREAETPSRFGQGLILALLALVPALRSRALCNLRTDDLVMANDGYRLTIRAKIKKGKRRSHTVPLPSGLTADIDRWLHHHRHALLDPARPTDTLMLTGAGSPYQRATLWKVVAGLTEAGLGVRIGPHRIRHSAATWAAIHTPEHVREIPLLLDHAACRTSEEHYNLADCINASRSYGCVVLPLLEAAES
jgi:hypothetical protein